MIHFSCLCRNSNPRSIPFSSPNSISKNKMSYLLPFYFLADETKSILGSIIAYPVSAAVFIGLFLLLGNQLSTYVIIITVLLAVFIISWILTKKVLLVKDL